MKPGAIRMGRNEPCPCGSGIRYMDCCLNTKYLITYNYKNQAVLIDKNKINKNLRRIISLNKSLNRFRKSSFQDNNLDMSIALDYLKRVYEIVDSSLEEVGRFASCSKGCSQCCSKQPLISWVEGEYIKNYLKEILVYEKPIIAGKGTKENHNKKECLFLSHMGECRICEVRPLYCRSRLVFSDPKECSDKEREVLKFSDAILDLANNTVKKITLFLDYENTSFQVKRIGHWFSSNV